MARIVRAAVVGSGLDFNWPRRCPRCGTRELLVPSTCRVARDRFGLGGAFETRTQMATMQVPMCQKHADANDVANMILEQGPLMVGVRGVVLMALAKLANLMYAVVRHGGFHRQSLLLWIVCAVVGLGGLAAMRWAQDNATVRALGWVRDMNVLKIWFRDERYAEDFKAANPVDTDAAVTTPAPWYADIGLAWIAMMLLFVWMTR
jgi:hypothetical protein